MALNVNLQDRVAIVTGAASGIGYAVCRDLLANGASVIGWDAKQFELSFATSRLSQQAVCEQVELLDPEQIEHAVSKVAARFGRVDLLVNSAGVVRRATATECSLEDWQMTIDVNLRATFLVAREVAKHMRNGGAIVNITSTMGFTGGLFPNAAYQASKGAVINLTRALAVEWAELNIRVNGVAPTFTNTPFITNLREDEEKMQKILNRTPMRRFAEVDEIADGVVFLLSDHAAMITGHTLPVDGGYLAH